jgi:shikimate kinase
MVDPQNYAALHNCGLIICVSARPDVIARRIAGAIKARPMLARGGMPLKQRIADLMEKRREAYARAALTIDTSELTVEQVVDAILDALAKLYPSIVHAVPQVARQPGLSDHVESPSTERRGQP